MLVVGKEEKYEKNDYVGKERNEVEKEGLHREKEGLHREKKNCIWKGRIEFEKKELNLER